MKPQKFNRVVWQCVALCVCLAAADASFAQAVRPSGVPESRPVTAPAPRPRPVLGPAIQTVVGPRKTVPVGSSIPLHSLLVTWSPTLNIADGYDSRDFPQPVCAKVGPDFKIFVFTNHHTYTGETSANFNQSNNVRVGEILTGADTYQLLPSKLPGKRYGFAAASALVSGGPDSTVYLFGGMKGTLPTDEVYSYTPATGFVPVAQPIKTDTVNFVWGARVGALAVQANGKIYLFGGHHGSTVLNQVQVFDPTNAANPFTILHNSPMPVALTGARGMAKAANGNVYIYVVGGSTLAVGPFNQNIYRFDVNNQQWATVKNSNGTADLKLPANTGAPMATWDMGGNVRVLAAGDLGPSVTWGNVEAWILSDTYSLPNVSKASLIPAPYSDPARARDRSSAVKCGNATYLIGGLNGNGSTFQNHGNMVDKLN